MRAPPFSTPPDLAGEFVQAWFIKPAGVVTWVPEGACFTNADAQLLANEIPIERMDAMYDDKPAFLFLHDWAGLRNYENKARSTIVNWGRSYPRDRIRTFHVRLDETSGAFIQMAVSAGALALTLAGYHFKTVKDFDAVLREFEVRPFVSAGAVKSTST